METIDLDIDEVNELTFKLRIEGMASGAVTARLYCESTDGLQHVVTGQFKGEPETVNFRVPQMSRLMQEGIYPAWIEVLVDNKQFTPASFNIKFKKPTSVQVESVENEIGHGAAPVVVVETVAVSKRPLEKKPIQTQPVAVTPINDGKTASLSDWYKKRPTKR